MPPAVSTVTSLTELATELQGVAEAALADTSGGTPSLSYIDAGPSPAFDCCPALIVYTSALGEDATSPQAPIGAVGQRARHGRRNLATLNIVVLRCAAELGPDGIPDAAAKTAIAGVVMEDGWALWTGIYNAIVLGNFRDLCSTIYFDQGAAVPEQGLCVGWYMTLRAELHGIPAGGGT